VDDYRSVNRANWDERVPVHVASREYGIERFVDDPAFLSDTVRFDRERLGDVSGLRGLHLQCHIGTDTISLARLGAYMIGLDFSSKAIAQARDLAMRAGAVVTFTEADVYDAATVLDPGSFDFVYTGVGALCWLPDVDRWAGVISALLRPGGRLFIRDAHPMLLTLAVSRGGGPLSVDFPYFERPEPIVWTEGGTYVETDRTFTHPTTYEWNHGLGEIVTALMAHGMDLTMLLEHDSAPWDALPGQTVETDGEWRLADRPSRLAQTFTLQAHKRL
jgi:SAM-dependent methyltransferase